MMRPISAQVDPELPYPPTVTANRTGNTVTLNWVETTPIDYATADTLQTWGSLANEIGFRIYRAPVNNGTVGKFTLIGTTLANKNTFTDNKATATEYRYRVSSFNAAGETNSVPVGGSVPASAPPKPGLVAANQEAGPQVRITWNNVANENFYLVEVSKNGGPYTLIAQVPSVAGNTGAVQYVDTMVSASMSYQYRISAVNGKGSSAFALSNPIAATPVPAAPTGLGGSAVTAGTRANVNLTWTDASNNETGFTIERATNATFTTQVVTTPVPANTSSAAQTGLNRKVTYYFRIKADNAGGSSGWSNTFTIKTP